MNAVPAFMRSWPARNLKYNSLLFSVSSNQNGYYVSCSSLQYYVWDIMTGCCLGVKNMHIIYRGASDQKGIYRGALTQKRLRTYALYNAVDYSDHSD